MDLPLESEAATTNRRLPFVRKSTLDHPLRSHVRHTWPPDSSHRHKSVHPLEPLLIRERLRIIDNSRRVGQMSGRIWHASLIQGLPHSVMPTPKYNSIDGSIKLTTDPPYLTFYTLQNEGLLSPYKHLTDTTAIWPSSDYL